MMPVVLDLIARKIKQGKFTEAIRLLLWLKNNFSGVTLTMPADYLSTFQLMNVCLPKQVWVIQAILYSENR